MEFIASRTGLFNDYSFIQEKYMSRGRKNPFMTHQIRENGLMYVILSLYTVGDHSVNALVIVFPELGGGGGGELRAVGWGVGDLAGILQHKLAYLCPRGGGDEGPLIYYPTYPGEILGLCFS